MEQAIYKEQGVREHEAAEDSKGLFERLEAV